MERIRVDLGADQYLRSENRDNPGRFEPIDGSYVGLLQRYRGSDAPSVRYTAEREVGRLTGQIELDVWIDALDRYRGSPFHGMARSVLAGYAYRFSSQAPEVTGNERAQLIAAATTPDPLDPASRPQPLPQPANVRAVRAWNRFGTVAFIFNPEANLGASGYSMLFERRGDRWVFLTIYGGWIS
jgi:hypothetical protein